MPARDGAGSKRSRHAMSPGQDGRNALGEGAEQFATTHWSLVLAAGRRSSPDSNEALSELCRTYWYPLYVYVRRRVPHADEAQDLTQEFFTRLLEKNYLSAATPTRGRFRAFLLTAVQHFLANEWDKARAQKRGGGQVVISLDFRSGESRYSVEPADGSTPERLYERQWVLTLLDHVLARLGEELALAGKSRDFQQLKVFITSEGTPGGLLDRGRRAGHQPKGRRRLPPIVCAAGIATCCAPRSPKPWPRKAMWTMRSARCLRFWGLPDEFR